MELHAHPTERKFCHGHFCEGPWGPSAGLLWSSKGQGVANPTRAVSFPCYERQAPFLLVSARENRRKTRTHPWKKVCPANQQVSWHFSTFLVTVTYWPPTISGSYLKPRKITNSQTCQPLVFRSHYSGQKHDEICIRMRNFCEYVSCCLVLSFVSLPATIPPLYFLASRTVKPIWFQNVCKFIIAIKEKEFHIELFFWDVCCCSLIMKESKEPENTWRERHNMCQVFLTSQSTCHEKHIPERPYVPTTESHLFYISAWVLLFTLHLLPKAYILKMTDKLHLENYPLIRKLSLILNFGMAHDH